MKLKPALKEKKRYIMFKLHSKEPIPYTALKQAVTSALLEFLGERDFAKAHPRLIKNLCTGRAGVLLTTPKHTDACKLSLALIHQIQEQPVAFQTLKVSGTIKSGKKAL